MATSRRIHFVLLISCSVSVTFTGSGIHALSFSPLPVVSTSSRSAATATTSLSMSSFLEGGWDNDNFLESLSRGGSGGNTAGGEAETSQSNSNSNEPIHGDSRQGQSVMGGENRRSASSPTNSYSSSTPSYKDALQQRRQQQQQQQQQQTQQQQQQQSSSFSSTGIPDRKDDMTRVSDAAAEVYSYSYNKNVDAPAVGTPSPVSSDDNESGSNDGKSSVIDPSTGAGEAKGTTVSKELVAKAKASHENDLEESSQGGSRFRDLMDRAREQQQRRPQPSRTLQPQQQQQQQRFASREEEATHVFQDTLKLVQDHPKFCDEYIERAKETRDFFQDAIAAEAAERRRAEQARAMDDSSITPPSSIMTPEELENLSIEEQARLYREFFYVQQKQQNGSQSTESQQQQQQTVGKSIGSTSSNYLEAGIGFDGRKIGRNKDADAVSNASDVYFAQLKRDSTTRNLARYSGDHTKANEVFHDPSIQDIAAPVNPYLQDQQKRMRDVIETVPEEMLLFQEFDAEDGSTRSEEEMKSYSGVSYQQKLAQKKAEQERRRNQQPNNDGGNNSSFGNSYPQ